MAPRLAHKKSRKGCQRCKARKVKCDELRPICSACHRHAVPCKYRTSPPAAPDARSHLAATDHSSLSADSPNSPSSTNQSSLSGVHVSGPASPYDLDDAADIDPSTLRLLELQLLHHFIIVVVESFATTGYNPKMRSMWTVEALALALEPANSYLLNAIFAISALHIAVEGLNSKPPASSPHVIRDSAIVGVGQIYPALMAKPLPNVDYANAHRIYLNRAVQGQRQVLSALSTAHADAVFLTSILLSNIAARLIHEEQTISYSPPVRWLSMSHAISSVIQASKTRLQRLHLFEAILAEADVDFRNPHSMHDESILLTEQPILDFALDSEEHDEELKSVYRDALTYTGAIARAIKNGDPVHRICRRITSFGPALSGRVSTLLEERRPRMLVIFACFMSTVKYAEHYWLFRGAAEREVYGVQSILPAEWQWAMNWPLQTLRTLTDARKHHVDGDFV